jgi:TPP-dependent 2-oxoacid decarboxylase
MEDTIPFATYFVERLKQCGVKYVQGVPGDYNLELVSHFQGKEVDY